MHRSGEVRLQGHAKRFQKAIEAHAGILDPRDMTARFLFSLAGLNPEPLFVPGLLYFHSYRKVQEGSPELGMMVERRPLFRRTRFRPGFAFPISTFKLEILRAMMGQARLFEGIDDEEQEAGDALTRLNDLVVRYAAGRIEKLRPSPDSTIELW